MGDMGLQGQVMLNRMGEEFLNYLVEKGHIKNSTDQNIMMEQINKFFLEQGFLSNVEFNSLGQDVKVAHKGWSIFDSVGRLSQAESPLQPCPHCLVVTSLLRAGGTYVKYAGSEVVDESKKDIMITLRVLKREFDEDKIMKAFEGEA